MDGIGWLEIERRLRQWSSSVMSVVRRKASEVWAMAIWPLANLISMLLVVWSGGGGGGGIAKMAPLTIFQLEPDHLLVLN